MRCLTPRKDYILKMETTMNRKEKRYTFSAIKQTHNIALASNKKLYILYITLCLISTGSTFVALAAIQYSTSGAYRLFFEQAELTDVCNGVLLFSIAAILFRFVRIAQNSTFNKLSLDMKRYFEYTINDKLSSIRWDYYETHETNINIFTVRTKSLQATMRILQSIISYLTAIPYIIIYSYYLFQINVFAVVIYVVLLIVVNCTVGKRLNSIWKLWDEAQAYQQREKYFISLTGDKITHQEYRQNRLFGYLSHKWSELFDCEYKVNMKIYWHYEIRLQTARFILNLPYILMMILTAYEIIIGKHEIGFLLLANRLFNNIIDTYMSVQNSIMTNQTESKYLKLLTDVMSYETVEPALEKYKETDIHVKDVSFVYPQSQRNALDHLTVSIKHGEKIAIVGVNGSGKTTFCNLLMGLTDQFSGSIVDKEGALDLGKSVTCIIQDFSQYEMTIRENIEMGDTDKDFTDDEIIDLLEKVGLKEYVMSLAQGIDTPLGQLDEGVELSKGQWQRLAIARLLANPKATIWILDEPTAYLDPMSEIDLYNLIYQLSGSRTVIFISHRLGFARKANRILVFENGHIVEEGTHEKLLKQNGIYAGMYANQLKWYSD